MALSLDIPRALSQSAVRNVALRPKTALRLGHVFRNSSSSTATPPIDEGAIATEKIVTLKRPGHPEGLALDTEKVENATVGDDFSQVKPEVRRHPSNRDHRTKTWDAPSREAPRHTSRRQVQREPGQKVFFRFARILGLDLSASLTDIVEGIAQTAPVGRVLSVQFERKIQVMDGREVRTAVVLFDHEAAPPDLVRLAKQGSFRICGRPLVAVIYRGRAFHQNDEDKFSSRVLQLRGDSSVEGFSEEGIRDVLTRSPEVMRALGPLGLESEPVETRDFANGTRVIEWRFFDNHKQVRILLPVLRRYYYKQLFITPGRDPCWDSRLYPKERSSFKSAFYTSTINKSYSDQSLPPLPQSRARETIPSSDPPAVETPLLQLIKRSQAARNAAAAEDDATAETFGGAGGVDQSPLPNPEITEPLEEERRKRIAAWTHNYLFESVSKNGSRSSSG